MGLIYKIQNKENGKIYIGQTQTSLKNRLAKHNEVVFTSNCHIHRAIRKYGWDAFTVEVIEENITNENLNEREKYWIEYYNSYENGYNMNRGGEGRVIKEDQVLKLWQEGNTITDITKILPTSKNTVRQILHEANIPSQEIQERKCIHRSPIIDYDYIKQLWDEGKTTRQIRELCGNIGQGTLIKVLDELDISATERASRQHKTKKVQQYTLDGVYITTFNSATEAGERYNINPHQIRATCNGKQNSSGGFKWKYE